MTPLVGPIHPFPDMWEHDCPIIDNLFLIGYPNIDGKIIFSQTISNKIFTKA